MPLSDNAPRPAKSNTGRNVAIFGGLGCVALLIVGFVALCVISNYYAGSSNANTSNGNSISITVNNSNSLLANRGTIRASNSNSIVYGNDNAAVNNNSSGNNNSSSKSSGVPTDEEFRNFLPPQVEEYERQGDSLDGNITEDYPGADKITKAEYLKKNKKVSVVVAQFSSPATAKQSYGYFLDGFKGAKARVLTKQKVKNKSGIETGDLAIYVFKSKWETLVYADRFGFRITAPDRVTLADFLKQFGSYIDLISDK